MQAAKNEIARIEKTQAEIEEIDEIYESVPENQSYLIFLVGGEKYAIKTVFVKEILHSAKIHPLPFVPDYIEGVVNCHGTPFTVVNTLKMESEENSSIAGGTVLVFKREDDDFAIHISNIDMFFEPEENDIKDDGIRYKMKIIPYFDADIIEQKLKNDLQEKEDE